MELTSHTLNVVVAAGLADALSNIKLFNLYAHVAMPDEDLEHYMSLVLNIEFTNCALLNLSEFIVLLETWNELLNNFVHLAMDF